MTPDETPEEFKIPEHLKLIETLPEAIVALRMHLSDLLKANPPRITLEVAQEVMNLLDPQVKHDDRNTGHPRFKFSSIRGYRPPLVRELESRAEPAPPE